MKNVLFLIFHGFDASSGISKKIHSQVEAMRAHKMNVRLCYLDESTGEKHRMVDSEVIANYGGGLKGKIYKRIEFNSILDFTKREKIEFVYVRSDLNANPLTIRLFKKLREQGIYIVMEIPTYPYDHEEDSKARKPQRWLDRRFRNNLARFIDKIVTYSDYETIFGCSTIRISNGIEFNKIALRPTSPRIADKELHLIAVAEIHYWHGFDRLVAGLAEYYAKNPDYKVYFHLVGDFFSKREQAEIVNPIKKYNLQDYVLLHGRKNGIELDKIFEYADIAVGSLGRHRSGINNIKTLKNREYAARGFAFIYSETDSDFEEMPYILKVPADESPIEIEHIIDFYHKLSMSPIQIRESIVDLSWENQMKKVFFSI